MAPSIRNTDHVHDILKDDETGRDQNFVDELLTKEMLKLSVKDRNDIQEEIHGVKCLAIEENEELIRTSLRQLEEEIHQRIPDLQKRAYLQSLQPVTVTATATATATKDSNTNPDAIDSSKSNNNHRSYIHGDEFRLRFLRCELFDIPKAALRMVTYLDLMVELFGPISLQRPITLADFTKDELRHMRKGMIQILPYRDRSGRRIIICFPEEEVSQIPPFCKAKIAMYLLWAVGDKDIVTQKMGFIVLTWFDASFAKLNASWKIKYKFYTLNCDRITAIHCCSPDTQHYRFRRSIMVMRCGVENRSKLIFHLGESMEIHYKLQGYGIPFEHVPISWTGKVKIAYLKQWMKIRQAVERQRKPKQQQKQQISNGNSIATSIQSDDSVSSNGTSSSSAENDIIECPQLQDVIFRQGTSSFSHPGNVTFRSLIETTVVTEQFRQQQQRQHPNSSSKANHKRPKQLAVEIFEERQRTSDSMGLFLVWNNEKGWWNKLTDKEQICMKIEYLVREFLKLSQKRSGMLMFKKKAASTNTSSINSNNNHRINASTSNSNSKKDNIVNLQSGTSLFCLQDGESTKASFFANKRQRLSNNNGNSDDFGKSKMECFGMQFTPCHKSSGRTNEENKKMPYG